MPLSFSKETLMNRLYILVPLSLVSLAVAAPKAVEKKRPQKLHKLVSLNPFSPTANVIANNAGDGVLITNNSSETLFKITQLVLISAVSLIWVMVAREFISMLLPATTLLVAQPLHLVILLRITIKA